MLDLSALNGQTRLLFTIPLQPVQGQRFQPTGFPSLGAATYQSSAGNMLLVESAQSMANRLEATCWDDANNKPVAALDGISHITVNTSEGFLTDSMLEAHRLNSVYIENCLEAFPEKKLSVEIGIDKQRPVNRKKFLAALLKYDIGCLLHGVFIESLDGRLRISRAMSAFIEASDYKVAASGGVKNDRVNATKDELKSAKDGFGNVPFARDEYVAGSINLYVNIDLAQIRGYGLGEQVERLLILLALYKIRKLIDGDLRLRTACDLEHKRNATIDTRPENFTLPNFSDLESEIKTAIANCKDLMVHTVVTYDADLKRLKAEKAKLEKKSGTKARQSKDDSDSPSN